MPRKWAMKQWRYCNAWLAPVAKSCIQVCVCVCVYYTQCAGIYKRVQKRITACVDVRTMTTSLPITAPISDSLSLTFFSLRHLLLATTEVTLAARDYQRPVCVCVSIFNRSLLPHWSSNECISFIISISFIFWHWRALQCKAMSPGAMQNEWQWHTLHIRFQVYNFQAVLFCPRAASCFCQHFTNWFSSMLIRNIDDFNYIYTTVQLNPTSYGICNFSQSFLHLVDSPSSGLCRQIFK